MPNQIYANNSSGTPVTGGTLTMLGTGDVDYMDPNVSYYTIGYLGLREWSRQLYNYPAITGQTTNVVEDLATAMPTSHRRWSPSTRSPSVPAPCGTPTRPAR